MQPAELEQRLNKSAPFIWLRRRFDPAKAATVDALGIEGVGSLSEYKRFYPESDLAGSVVGQAAMDGQGLSGVELEYDRLIRGEPVELSFYHDALGHPILDSPLALKSPEPGAQLELTIDSRIQSLAENELAVEVGASGARRGTALVLDPFSGEILALANVSADPDPLHDRLHDAAVQDAFEPGSTMKGLLASIALADNAIAPNQNIYCENGEFHLANRTIHDDSRSSMARSRRHHRGVIEHRRGQDRAQAGRRRVSPPVSRASASDARPESIFPAKRAGCSETRPPGAKSNSPITASVRALR